MESKLRIDALKKDFGDQIEGIDLWDASVFSLSDAEVALQALHALKIKYTGKKSALAEAKRAVGLAPAEDRATFAQQVQAAEKEIVSRIEVAESRLNEFISAAKTERDRLDVTIPGRRPRKG